VDWYPWGAEAFEQARRLDKPVFLSIGYAACHWCHVMAHESFEDADIAALMNRLFINIKVDREERPDVDTIYMHAIQIMGQGGGWPLSAFLTPEGKPFFLGTYFPPASRYGRPGFPQVLLAMAEAYQNERDKIEHNVEGLMEGLRLMDEHHRRGATGAGLGRLDLGLIITAGRSLAQRSDSVNGGLGTQPKFPSSSSHDLLARAGRLRFGDPAREAFLLQAEKMARGGIYDHVGGGFARYSVDAHWLVPHFEKMLYDNGQLLAIYGDAYAMTENPDFARVITETVAWLEREMLDASGGLYASQDADSEGEEGKFYVWTPAQIAEVLGPVDAIFFNKSYGVTEAGNFEHQTTVLARVSERGADSDEAALADCRARLLAARGQRVAPATDDKILAAWNGLAVTGLLRAWAATGHPPAFELARRVTDFLTNEMVHDVGGGARVWRVYKDGTKKLDGTIDDYAFVARAFFDMAEATSEASFWQRGSELCAAMRTRFYEEKDGTGVFYMTPVDDPEPLIHRPESNSDGAIPSGAAVAVECLLRQGLLAGDKGALSVAEGYLGARAAQAVEDFFASSRLLAAVDLYVHGAALVITEGRGREALLRAARRAYAPTTMLAGPWASDYILAGKESAPDGAARAYLCRGQTCSAPVTEPEELHALLCSEPT
jgi:uncharacterized protein YyaL (SSP411 family)